MRSQEDIFAVKFVLGVHDMSCKRLHILICTMSLVVLSFSGIGKSQLNSEIEVAKNLIVMIQGTLQDEPTFGAGIVVGEQNNRLYIVTANHVVRRGEEEISDLKIEFRSLPGETFGANILSSLNKDLDIAVLSIDLTTLGVTVDQFPLERLSGGGITSETQSIYSIGYGNGIPWVSLVEQANVLEDAGNVMKVQFSNVNPGDSGGGIFDESGQFVGLITSDEPPAINVVKAQVLESVLTAMRFPFAQPAPVTETQPTPEPSQTTPEPASVVAPATSTEPVEEQTAVVDPSALGIAGVWDGEWSNASRSAVFKNDIEITIDSANNVSGFNVYTLITSGVESKSKVGLKATDYFAGTYDPETQRLNLKTTRSDDPDSIIASSIQYSLLLSADGNELSGATENGSVVWKRLSSELAGTNNLGASNEINSSLAVETFVDKDPSGSASPSYSVGGDISVSVRVNNAAYIYLYSIDASGSVSQLLPNRYDSAGQNNYLQAGETAQFPPHNARYTFNIEGPAGVSSAVAIGCKAELDTQQLADFSENPNFATSSLKKEEFLALLNSTIQQLPTDNACTMDSAVFTVE